MIDGQMRIPWIPIENERIGRRHAVFGGVGRILPPGYGQLRQAWKKVGEFFTPGQGEQHAPSALVEAFLTPVPESMRNDLRRILPSGVQDEIGIESDAWVTHSADLLDKAQKDVENDFETFLEH